LGLFVGQQGEQRNAPDEIEVREHRHRKSLSGCGRSAARPWKISRRAEWGYCHHYER
jgi:hypothetical protein